jgi:uncharacterized protein (TIGR01244 family)
MRGFLLSAILLGVTTAAADEIPAKIAADAIPNYRQMRPAVATGGQPSAETLRRLKSLGFKTVINLRTSGEDAIVDQEAAAVAAQGLTYVSVPVTPTTLSAADVAAVRKVLDDPAAAPVFLHCHSANRVGAVWAAVEVSRGRALKDAEAEGKKVGLSSQPMIDALHRVAGEVAPK